MIAWACTGCGDTPDPQDRVAYRVCAARVPYQHVIAHAHGTIQDIDELSEGESGEGRWNAGSNEVGLLSLVW